MWNTPQIVRQVHVWTDGSCTTQQTLRCADAAAVSPGQNRQCRGCARGVFRSIGVEFHSTEPERITATRITHPSPCPCSSRRQPLVPGNASLTLFSVTTSPAKLVEACIFRVRGNCPQPRQHPDHVSVHQRFALPEGDGGHGSCQRDARNRQPAGTRGYSKSQVILPYV